MVQLGTFYEKQEDVTAWILEFKAAKEFLISLMIQLQILD